MRKTIILTLLVSAVLVGPALSERNRRIISHPPIYATAYQNAKGTIIYITETTAFKTVYDNDDGGSRGITATDSTATIVVGGLYKIDYSLTFGNGTGSNEIEAAVSVNGTPLNPGRSHARGVSPNENQNVSGHAVVDLDTGDVVKIIVRNNTATTDVVVEHSNLTMWLMQ